MANTLKINLMISLLISFLAACGGGNSADNSNTPGEQVPDAPSASIVFPPESALIDFNLIRVRGTAKDVQGDEISSVSVNGVNAESDDGFATWQAIVPVDLGENTLVVSTADNQQNSNTAAATTIVQARALPFLKSPNSDSIKIDSANNRALVIDGSQDALLAFDLSTGQRTIISSNRGIDAFDNQQPVGLGPEFGFPNHLDFDNANQRVLVTELSKRQVFSVDLNTGERSVFFDMNNTSGSGPALRLIREAIFDLANNRMLILDGFNGDIRLFAISLTNEARTLISSNKNSGPAIQDPQSLLLDSNNNRVILSDTGSTIMAINLSDGSRRVLSGLDITDKSTVGDGPNFTRTIDVDIDNNRNQAVVVDDSENALFIVDLATGDRTLLEGSGPSFINLQAADFLGENQIVAVDADIETVILVDRSTGNRTLPPNNSIGEGPRLETPRSFAQIDSNLLLIADSEANHLLRVNVSNGQRSIFIDGKETILNHPTALTLDKAKNRVLIIDNVDNDESSPRLLSLDLESEMLSIITGDGSGSGPDMRTPESIVLDSANGRLLVTDSSAGALLSIDLQTGERTVLSNDSSLGPEFRHPRGIALKSDGNTVLVVDAGVGILFSINLQTGARTVLSGKNPDTDEVIGTEFELHDSYSMALDEVNNRVLVSNINDETLLSVDLNTGIAREVTGDFSAGPFFNEPIAVIFDTRDISRAFVLDSAFRAVFTVDLINGDRVLTSWSEVSPQNNLF